MLLVLDTRAAADSRYWDQLTQLDGREYLLRFFWSERESCWYLSVYDQDEHPLALGVKLVVGWPILKRFIDARLPPGLLMVADLSNTSRELEQPEDLLPTGRCPLLYMTADDEALARLAGGSSGSA